MVKFKSVILALVAAGIFAAAVFAQSTDQSFPTPVTSSEISGTIRARDIGDARLTTYYFTFNGGQGDIFINAVTSNFAGDIDVFTADTLQPLAKMVSYPDAANSETGRLIYLRRPARLLLRVEGRSPNDNPATFQIKFGGSFIALEGKKEEKAPVVSHSAQDETGIRVNSVGTILPPQPVEKPVAKRDKEVQPVSASESKVTPEASRSTPPKRRTTVAAPEVKTVFGAKTAVKDPGATPDATTPARRTAAKPAPPARRTSAASRPPRVVVEELKADPLASIHLVVELKSGDSVSSPMSEVLRFSVDRGVLTVILKNGKINRYTLAEVSSFTMR